MDWANGWMDDVWATGNSNERYIRLLLVGNEARESEDTTCLSRILCINGSGWLVVVDPTVHLANIGTGKFRKYHGTKNRMPPLLDYTFLGR